jgi:acyl-CoA synthetase (AMP-forming)/AMP-acid ligase II
VRTIAPSYAFATLWELVAARVPERTALVSGGTRRTYAQVDERAARLATWMRQHGVNEGSFVGLQIRNRSEHVEAMLAAYKLRAIPVNVNYRLREAELEYIYSNCGIVGIIHEIVDADVTSEAARRMQATPWQLAVGPDFESAIAQSATDPIRQRSGDDLYVVYTGGTTGRPRGVVWRMEDAFFACIGGGDPTGTLGMIAEPSQITERLVPNASFLPAPPLVHAAGMWSTLRWLLAGAQVTLLDHFSAIDIWNAVALERVAAMNIVGDAMGRPLLDAFVDVEDLDLSSLQQLTSGGARLSAATREGFQRAFPKITIKDSYGSSEAGVHGSRTFQGTSAPGGLTTRDTVLVDPVSLVELEPDVSSQGLIARRGHVPLRYHRHPEASARTFIAKDEVRYAVTGDWGSLNADGTLNLIGRGSECINTGGEKVFTEEVEGVLLRHPQIADAVVVGAPDATWGEVVVAIVTARQGEELDAAEVRAHCRADLAGFKVPKRVIAVEALRRTVAGKVDYGWARQVALHGTTSEMTHQGGTP